LELSATWHQACRVPLGVPALPAVPCSPLGRSDATLQCRDSIRDAFAALLEPHRQHGKTRFLNKNPHFWNKLPFIRALFPQADLIITARDLRSTVLSTQFLWMRVERQSGVRHYLPPEPDHCWTCLPEGAAVSDPVRTFPGGDVTVIAEYWLRVYETIDRAAALFDRPLVVKHREFVADPPAVLDDIHTRLGVEPRGRPLETTIDSERNNRWPRLLAAAERERLDAWIDRHHERLTRLESADTLELCASPA
jgi:hypothetical protein